MTEFLLFAVLDLLDTLLPKGESNTRASRAERQGDAAQRAEYTARTMAIVALIDQRAREKSNADRKDAA
jgi:hypothetical protein